MTPPHHPSLNALGDNIFKNGKENWNSSDMNSNASIQYTTKYSGREKPLIGSVYV